MRKLYYDKLVSLLERWSSDPGLDFAKSWMYGAIIASYAMGVISMDEEFALLRRYCDFAL